ncbi:putative mating type protein [Diaporthe ampelina]|uniref:Putative mating type protein n=1 Tax=Diaporthe ampelina TaxID=1214573 RepID=A0A0G2F9R3_9PEZI|nr:putative mating type protein [Diaporthe ampelina]
MDIENHTKVYLPNNIVVDASKEAGKAYRDDIIIRMAGNKYFAQVLRQGGTQKDQRILRVARLLDQLNGQEKKLCDLTDEVFDICAKEQRRYPAGAPNPEEQEPRKYIDGKPVPVLERNYYSGDLQPINWRFDPDIRMPSPYCKFLRFNGPYFCPTKPHPRELNTFFLPESLVNIIHYYTRRYDQAENNLRATGRLPTRTEEEEAEHLFQQKVLLGMRLAASTGENYDMFSIVNQLDHFETVENATKPYVFIKPGTLERQVNFGSGTGLFKPEDFNRAMKIEATGTQHHVPIVDHGRWVEMDRKIEQLETP